MHNTLLITFHHPDMVSLFPYNAMRESIKNVKTEEAALRTLRRRNLGSITHAVWNNKQLVASK